MTNSLGPIGATFGSRLGAFGASYAVVLWWMTRKDPVLEPRKRHPAAFTSQQVILPLTPIGERCRRAACQSCMAEGERRSNEFNQAFCHLELS